MHTNGLKTRKMKKARKAVEAARLPQGEILALLGAVIAALLLISPAMAQDGEAKVRMVHLSPDAPAVMVEVDGEPVEDLADVSYRDASPYLPIPAGPHEIAVFAVADPSEPVLEVSVAPEAGESYTIAGVGLLEDDSFGARLFEDDNSEPDEGEARLRVIHAVPDVGPATVSVADGPDLFSLAGFANASDYAGVEAGTYTLEVTPAGAPSPAFEVPDAEVEEGEVYTAFAIGQASEGTIDVIMTVDSDNGRLVGPQTLENTSGDLSLLENPADEVTEPQPQNAASMPQHTPTEPQPQNAASGTAKNVAPEEVAPQETKSAEPSEGQKPSSAGNAEPAQDPPPPADEAPAAQPAPQTVEPAPPAPAPQAVESVPAPPAPAPAVVEPAPAVAAPAVPVPAVATPAPVAQTVDPAPIIQEIVVSETGVNNVTQTVSNIATPPVPVPSVPVPPVPAPSIPAPSVPAPTAAVPPAAIPSVPDPGVWTGGQPVASTGGATEGFVAPAAPQQPVQTPVQSVTDTVTGQVVNTPAVVSSGARRRFVTIKKTSDPA